MKKSCLNCRYLSKDGSHLQNDYSKEALANDSAYYTCKFPAYFNNAWVFAVPDREPYKYDMMCDGENHQAKEIEKSNKMLNVQYTTEGVTNCERFPETKQGESKALKFIEKLHAERKQHDYYYHLARINTIEEKLKSHKLGNKSKERYRLESELHRLKTERQELLQILGIPDTPPQMIIVRIFRD